MNSRQEISSPFVKEADREGFGERLREAFGGVINAEIARKLDISEPAVKNYIDGRIPPADMLVAISGLTNCSVHWLLTGEGSKNVSRLELTKLMDRVRQAVESAKAKDPELSLWTADEEKLKGWAERGYLLDLKALRYVSLTTQTSLYWLLTGLGPQREEKHNATQPPHMHEVLSEYEARLARFGQLLAKHEGIPTEDLPTAGITVDLQTRIADKVKGLAAQEGKDVGEQAAELIIEALLARGEITDQVEGIHLVYFGEVIPKLVTVPLLGEISAGQPLNIFDTQDELVEIAEEYKTYGRRLFVLRVRGDSMVDEGILEGDLLICIESSEAYNGRKVVAIIDGDKASVKSFYRRGSQIVLQPANPKYPDIVLTPERVRVQGIVVGLQRRTI